MSPMGVIAVFAATAILGIVAAFGFAYLAVVDGTEWAPLALVILTVLADLCGDLKRGGYSAAEDPARMAAYLVTWRWQPHTAVLVSLALTSAALLAAGYAFPLL